GRLWLWRLMELAGEGNYFYCDTDSLFVNSVGLYNLGTELDNLRLGAIKVIEQTDSISIRGVKDYSIGTKRVIKGIRKLAIEVSEGVYEQELWPSFKGLLRSQHPDVYAIAKIRKTLSRKYTKGVVNEDGSISPLFLSES
ncbi:unnamed protein product, partial [marine sediment metagenome]